VKTSAPNDRSTAAALGYSDFAFRVWHLFSGNMLSLSFHQFCHFILHQLGNLK